MNMCVSVGSGRIFVYDFWGWCGRNWLGGYGVTITYESLYLVPERVSCLLPLLGLGFGGRHLFFSLFFLFCQLNDMVLASRCQDSCHYCTVLRCQDTCEYMLIGTSLYHLIFDELQKMAWYHAGLESSIQRSFYHSLMGLRTDNICIQARYM